MRGWSWLTDYPYTLGFLVRVLLKTAVLFIVLNFVFAIADPLPLIGRVTLYNTIVPGRDRLPYGEDSASYNLSLNSLDAMFASHRVSQPKAADEFRIFVIGDSSVWGILLDNEETISGQINALGLEIDGRRVVAYNLGHPILSVTKDLMLLDYAMQYQPDMIVWLITLESMAVTEQLRPPLVANNASRVRDLIARYSLPLDPNSPDLITPSWLDRTLVGQRRALADWLRLQSFASAWAATGIDQVYADYTPRADDFEADLSWLNFSEPISLPEGSLAFEIIEAGHLRAGDTRLLIVNEPIYRAGGENSDLRYNAWYPRWAYDQYREQLSRRADEHAWVYLDLWDLIAPEQFTDSPVHLTPDGTRHLAGAITSAISENGK